MAIEAYGLNEAVVEAVGDVITVYLHTGNPGGSGTANRVPTGALGGKDIPAGTSGWAIDASLGRAVAAANPDFGTAGEAVDNVSWMSMFKGTNFYARRALSASVDIALGAPVDLDKDTVVIDFNSTD